MRLSKYIKQALIGLFLGDLHGIKNKPNHNTRLSFDQSKEKHSEYLIFLYQIFKEFVGTTPKSTKRKPDKRTGKIYDSLIFKTLSFPCFNEFMDLFYLNGKKIVPLDIEKYMT